MGQTFTQPNSALISPDGSIAIAPPQHIMQEATRRAQEAGTDQAKLDKLPRIGTPTAAQAANSGPGGTPNALSPGLSKAGKLVTLLTSGLQGALAGRAAQEQTIAQTGGRRAGGVGMGFQSGLQAPFLRAQMPLQLQQQQAETQLAQAGAQPIETPYGNMPASLASKIIAPTLGYQGKVEAARIGEQGQEARAGATKQAAETGAESRIKVAQINQGVAIPVDETTAKLAGFPELAGQQGTRATWTNINRAIEARGYRVQDMGKNGEDPNSGMWLMDRAGNRIHQISPNSLTFQRGASFAQNRPVVVTDPNDPGYAYYTTAAQAMNQQLPSTQGAGTVAARTEARAEVPTKIGDLKVAFNTAMQHADLLREAAKAMKNGDMRLLNNLSNRAQSEFGDPALTNFNAIAGAYSRELTKMLSAGHMTDAEIGSASATLPSDANFATIDKVLGSYKSLAQSKLNMLNNQVSAATAPRRPQSKAGNEIRYKIVNGQLVKQ